MNTISACMLTWNEEEMMPYILRHIDSLQYISEVCIVDSCSTDNTEKIIKEFEMTKKIKFKSHPFKDFASQANLYLDMAEGDWILLYAPDETYSQNIDLLLKDFMELNFDEDFNGIKMPTIEMVRDRKHYLQAKPNAPLAQWSLRMFRGLGYCHWQGDVHEYILTKDMKNLHFGDPSDAGILYTWDIPKYRNMIKKHYALLKSDKSLIEKGEHWERLGILTKSDQRGISIQKDFWLQGKNTGMNMMKVIFS